MTYTPRGYLELIYNTIFGICLIGVPGLGIISIGILSMLKGMGGVSCTKEKIIIGGMVAPRVYIIILLSI